MTTGKVHCPVCSSSAPALFFEMNDVPVLCNVLHATHGSAVGAPRGSIRLGFCKACGHICNYAFNPTLTNYTQAYENSLHFSPRFQKYAGGLARDLIARYDLHNKTVVEIGCGKGDFLKMICDAGDNRGVGFDTSFQPELVESNERFTVIRDFYSEKYSEINTDFLICRHVLEHIESPRTFLTDIFNGPNTISKSYFEVPNVLWTLRDLGVWDLIYEHCSYFTPQSLGFLFTSSGFAVLRLEEKYNGQFLGIEIESVKSQTRPGEVDSNELHQLVRSFGENYRAKLAQWRDRFSEWKQKHVVVWGSGSKGVTFLNVLKPATVEYVVDINPRKQGMFVAGTGQRIVAPAFLDTYHPDVVIIMNPIYEREITQMLGSNIECVVA